MLNRSTIMRNAWANYRRDRNSRLPFSRRFFARCLADAWAGAKARAAYEAEKAGKAPIVVPLPSLILADLPDLGFYAGRLAMQPNELRIRAEHARAYA